MIEFAKRYARNSFSQNGEDGIIAECLKRMCIKEGVSVEFGAPDKFYCSNTQALRGWTKFFYDLSESDGVIKKEITTENVNELPICEVLSIDTDGADWYIWKAYTGKPKIVIVEINSSFPPHVSHISLDRGSSYKSMVELGLSKGYFLLCHTGNLIFILNEYKALFPEITGDPLYNSELYFNKNWL
jgi:hypothetical protein